MESNRDSCATGVGGAYRFHPTCFLGELFGEYDVD